VQGIGDLVAVEALEALQFIDPTAAAGTIGEV
jgi:hypothetical protein